MVRNCRYPNGDNRNNVHYDNEHDHDDSGHDQPNVNYHVNSQDNSITDSSVEDIVRKYNLNV